MRPQVHVPPGPPVISTARVSQSVPCANTSRWSGRVRVTGVPLAAPDRSSDQQHGPHQPIERGDIPCPYPTRSSPSTRPPPASRGLSGGGCWRGGPAARRKLRICNDCRSPTNGKGVVFCTRGEGQVRRRRERVVAVNK